MVAYSFKRQFIDPIKRGTKRQTIRADRKRHARPDEPVQLYYALRTKHAVKLLDPDPVCVSVQKVLLDFRGQEVTVEDYLSPTAVVHRGQGDLDAFARADGFTDWKAMQAFWQEGHEGNELLAWDGVLIKWRPAE